MKVHLHQLLVFLFTITAGILPVAAITAGNGSYTGSPVQGSTVPYLTTTSQAIAVPTINISQNIGFVPLWLVIGIILVIIAITGLLWRYFHPTYVAPEEDE